MIVTEPESSVKRLPGDGAESLPTGRARDARSGRPASCAAILPRATDRAPGPARASAV